MSRITLSYSLVAPKPSTVSNAAPKMNHVNMSDSMKNITKISKQEDINVPIGSQSAKKRSREELENEARKKGASGG